MEIDTSVRDLVSSLKDRCPNLSPALFLTQLTPNSLEHLCSTPLQVQQVKSWLSKRNEASYAFINEVDYAKRIIRIVRVDSMSELDAALSNLESMMRMMIVGDETELVVAMTRFLEVNGYKGDIPEERHIFNESYNIAYAIKVLISNTPGMKITMGDQELPFESDVDVGQILIKLHEKSAALQNDSDDEDESVNITAEAAGKKRKRKRGKAV